MIASFFEERVEAVTLSNGGTAYIQRPKAKPEASVQSAKDLPDDFSIASITANSDESYRIKIGPLEVGISLATGAVGPIHNSLRWRHR